MKKFLKKIDIKFFTIAESFILNRVVKSKFKKHKYHVNYKYELGIFIALAVVTLLIYPIALALDNSSMFLLLFHYTMWTFIIIMQYHKFTHISKMSEEYDTLFQNRKNPIIYRQMKHLCKAMFENSTLKKHRISGIKIFFLIIFVVLFFLTIIMFSISLIKIGYASLWIVLFIDIAYQTVINRYIECIFDFDPPKRKEKQKQEALTPLMAKSWKNLARTFKPVPIKI